MRVKIHSLSLWPNNTNENHSFDSKKHDLSVQSASRIELHQMFTFDKKIPGFLQDWLWGKFLDSPTAQLSQPLTILSTAWGENRWHGSEHIKSHIRELLPNKKECLLAWNATKAGSGRLVLTAFQLRRVPSVASSLLTAPERGLCAKSLLHQLGGCVQSSKPRTISPPSGTCPCPHQPVAERWVVCSSEIKRSRCLDGSHELLNELACHWARWGGLAPSSTWQDMMEDLLCAWDTRVWKIKIKNKKDRGLHSDLFQWNEGNFQLW